MNYDEITKITAERISDYMTEAVNTDSKAVVVLHSAAHDTIWGQFGKRKFLYVKRII